MFTSDNVSRDTGDWLIDWLSSVVYKLRQYLFTCVCLSVCLSVCLCMQRGISRVSSPLWCWPTSHNCLCDAGQTIIITIIISVSVTMVIMSQFHQLINHVTNNMPIQVYSTEVDYKVYTITGAVLTSPVALLWCRRYIIYTGIYSTVCILQYSLTLHSWLL